MLSHEEFLKAYKKGLARLQPLRFSSLRHQNNWMDNTFEQLEDLIDRLSDLKQPQVMNNRTELLKLNAKLTRRKRLILHKSFFDQPLTEKTRMYIPRLLDLFQELWDLVDRKLVRVYFGFPDKTATQPAPSFSQLKYFGYRL